MITVRFTSLVVMLIAAAACGSSSSTPSTQTTSSAPYSQTDLAVGTGATAATGDTVTVRYTGWLYDTSKTEGKGSQFDSNTFQFRVGAGTVIRGWDMGIPGMRVGGSRRLIIPPDLAYGSAGRAPIPPNATLIFDVTLVSIP